METASLSEIKNEIKSLTPQQLQEIITRLARFKKENKELLSYLLFEAPDEQNYINAIKTEIDEQFRHLNRGNLYLAKKTLRKSIKNTNKYIRFSGSKETEVELLLHFCLKMKNSGLRINSSRVVVNIYKNQVKRIQKVLSTLHEDLQYDYEEQIKLL